MTKSQAMLMRKGFTIIEMLLYISLLTLFMVVLVQIFSSVLTAELQSESSSSLTQDSRFILARLSYDLENASSVTTPASLGQTSNTLQFISSGVTYSYSLDANGNLLVTASGVSNKLNSLDTKVDSITFHSLGNTGGKVTVQVLFTIESLVKEQSGVRKQNMQVTIGLR